MISDDLRSYERWSFLFLKPAPQHQNNPNFELYTIACGAMANFWENAIPPPDFSLVASLRVSDGNSFGGDVVLESVEVKTFF